MTALINLLVQMRKYLGAVSLGVFVFAPVIYIFFAEEKDESSFVWVRISAFYLLIGIGGYFIFSRKGNANNSKDGE